MDGAFLLDKMPRFPGRKVEVEAGNAGEGTCSIWKCCEELLLGELELGEYWRIQKTFGAVWQLGTEGLRRGLGY